MGGEEGVMCEPKLCVTVLGHCGSASDKVSVHDVTLYH